MVFSSNTGRRLAVWAVLFFAASAQAAVSRHARCDYYADVAPGKSAEEGFTAQKKLGSAALVTVWGSTFKVETNSPGWQALTASFADKKTLTHDEIRAFLAELKNRPFRKVRDNRGTIDLVDALYSKAHRDAALTVLAQVLFERYTKLDTRLVVDKEAGNGSPVLLAKGKKGTWRLLDPSSTEEPDASGKTFSLPHVISESREWVDGKKGFTVLTPQGKSFELEVKPEGKAEKQFKAERDAFNKAKPEDMVTVEWLFHPYYRPFGHTSVRIGNQIYELSRKQGWRAHNSGIDDARAFLFSNPFFKRQYATFQEEGMPPYSIGATLKVPKERAQALLERMRDKAANPEDEPFCILTNNCNQGMLRAMAATGIQGMPTGEGYLGFSSVLTFNKLINGELGIQPESINAYPISGVELTQDQARATFPKTLSEPNGVLPEIWRNAAEAFGDWRHGRGQSSTEALTPIEGDSNYQR